jgi:hypothetical protein
MVKLPSDPEQQKAAVVAAMNSFLQTLINTGKDITSGDFTVRNVYDSQYLTDRLMILWDPAGD